MTPSTTEIHPATSDEADSATVQSASHRLFVRLCVPPGLRSSHGVWDTTRPPSTVRFHQHRQPPSNMLHGPGLRRGLLARHGFGRLMPPYQADPTDGCPSIIDQRVLYVEYKCIRSSGIRRRASSVTLHSTRLFLAVADGTDHFVR